MEKKSNLGLIAMIVGIVAIIISIFGGTLSSGNVVVAFILVFVALAAGIVGIVLGVKARKDPNTSKGMATAGCFSKYGFIYMMWLWR
mgnify:CR=1 FL=1